MPGKNCENNTQAVDESLDYILASYHSDVDLLKILFAIFENCTTAVFIKDISGKYLLVNQRFADILKLPIDKIIGKKDSDFLLLKAIRQIRLHDEKVIKESRPIHFEEYAEINGTVRYFYSTRFPVYFSKQYSTAICGISTDITEKKAIEEALKESEEFHRLVLENISDAVFLTDDYGQFIFICPNVDTIFGYNPYEVRKMKNISNLLLNLKFCKEHLNKSGEISNIKLTIQDKFNVDHYLLVNIKKVSIRGGSRLYTCRDITHHRKTENELTWVKSSMNTEQQILHNRNISLEEQINKIKDENEQLKFHIKKNINGITIPLLENTKYLIGQENHKYIDLAINSLKDISSPLGHLIEKNFPDLSKREIGICNMLLQGSGSKEIAGILGISSQTVIKQRKNIRKKLGIANSRSSIESCLKSL